ncbi:hypothetical protein [Clostridium sp. L74]|uniref:hypothetical protein n=1 Tax=Clostridium sp. L74 TaxID=1560217 RepID=UPI0006C1D574|nr:hypothetical protein [Clostridium sp. L74]KOR24791.1 hypothetical protein ND00_22380 [Clostridium sp. L74]
MVVEKKARLSYIKYAEKNFPNIRFKEIEDMEHGEFIIMHPKECASMIVNIIK